jgi:hypothetical protein
MKEMSNRDIRMKGLKVLWDNLGPDNVIRFLHQYDIGKGDYTQERQAWKQRISIKQIVNGVETKRQAKKK